MDLVTSVQFAVGFVLLVGGAELLVRGAAAVALALGISPLVIGLTVVAAGTGSPELAVSVGASAEGQTDVALGNVVGSNICNVLLILGVSALAVPLIVSHQLVRLEVPLMIGASFLLLGLSLNGTLGRWEALLLLAGGLAYLAFSVWQGRKVPAATDNPQRARPPRRRRTFVLNLALIVVGLGMLLLGSRWLVNGAEELAAIFDVSELIVGLTVVAIGTSLPELATSVVAGLRGQRDIAVGNIVGSNLFNILVILGLSGLVAEELPVPDGALRFDIPVMIAAAVACLPFFFTGRLVARWEGAVFLAYYVAYVLYLLLDATDHDALPAFSWVMAVFVMPLTVVTVLYLALRALAERRPAVAERLKGSVSGRAGRR